MQTTIHPTVTYRVPRFSLNADLKTSWSELKEAIRLSSTDFYEVIKDTTADQVEQLSPTVRQTIWKYFNRARFRATPYGTFAAFGCTQLSKQSSGQTLTIDQDLIVHRFKDWSMKDELTMLFSEIVEKDELLFTNSTFYKLGSNIRYVYFEDGGFQLSEIHYSQELIRILQQCSKPVKISSLLEAIAQKNQHQLLSQIEYLLSVQLLLHSGQPNVIGQDYFQRRNIKQTDAANDYILSECRPLAGYIDAGLFRHVPALIDLLTRLIPPPEDTVLNGFISRFVKRFEQQEIPLMLALDPEAGVGYDELEQAEAEDNLVNILGMTANAKPDEDFKKPLAQSIVNSSSTNIRSIDLEQLDLPYPETEISIANTISLMCMVSGGAIRIENIGGATANALNGRFTAASNQVHALCRELADLEQQANPGVVFFDIGYTAENKVDNINRRKSIYSCQLNLLNYDTSDVPLALNDLLISVRGKELILRSKQLSKRLIPRLASAYNYQRSDLSVFRLLCDLQRQGLHFNLNLSLESLIPGMDYYPELRFRNVIVSPRKWKMQAKTIGSYLNFLNFTNDLTDCKHIRTGTGDQTLCFDLGSDTDMKILYHLLCKEKQLTIEEICIPNESIFSDDKGEPYLGQLILNVTHNQTLYKPLASSPDRISKEVTRLFPPGGQWLYYEIYCHPYRTDELLLGKIQSFLKANRIKITTWFFIRYNEGGTHLRLRLKLNNPKIGYQLTGSLSEALKEEIESGIVADLRISIYRREIDRYGADNMEDIEAHFSQDSSFVVNLLSYTVDSHTKYRLCIQLWETITCSGVFDDEELYQIVRRNSEAFNKEHNLRAEDFRKLNKEYNVYRNMSFAPMNTGLVKLRKAFELSFLSVLSNCPHDKKAALFTDLMHMHVNRLFADYQRKHEMVFYYFLVKDLLRQKAMR